MANPAAKEPVTLAPVYSLDLLLRSDPRDLKVQPMFGSKKVAAPR